MACAFVPQDHKASDPEEVARIEKAGGFVLRKRVLGVLAVARSFGDFALKKFVPCTPYTSTKRLDSTVSVLAVGDWARLAAFVVAGLTPFAARASVRSSSSLATACGT